MKFEEFKKKIYKAHCFVESVTATGTVVRGMLFMVYFLLRNNSLMNINEFTVL